MNRVIEYLCRISGDKWAHLLTCLLITFVVGQGVHIFSDYDMATCAAIGGVTAMILGCAKEAFDEFRGGEVDYKDLVADFIGCLLGLLVTMF